MIPADLQDRVLIVRGTASRSRRALRAVLPILSVAFLLRLAVVLFTYKNLPASDHFERFGAEMGWTARSLALGQGFSSPFFPRTGPTALVCPLYPLLLAGIFKIFGIYSYASAFVALASNSALSSLTAAVIFFGMRRNFGQKTARCAAWMWALYPYAVYYSAAYLWDCALTSFLFACCFFLAINRLPRMRLPGWAAFGVLVGLAALSNPSVLSTIPFLVLWALWIRHKGSRNVWLPLLSFAALLLVTVAPWTIRNTRVMRQPVLMRDGFWGEFYAGNAGDTSHSNPGWTHPASSIHEMHKYQELGETGYMSWKRTLSVQRVQQYPGAFVLVSLRRVLRFWTGYWSFSHGYLADEALDVPNVPLCSVLLVLMGLGTWRLYQSDREAAFPYLTTFAVFPLPYYVTHASMDYRQPIEPIMVAAVTYGLACLARSRREANVAAIAAVEAVGEQSWAA